MCPKLQTTQLDLTFSTPTGTTATYCYVDLARQLSAINRKLYRSGYCYAVSGITVHGTAGDLFVINKVPEGYSTYEAWNAAFDAWRRQRAETLDTSSQVTGRWSDFKPYMDQGHLQTPDPLNSIPTVELMAQVDNGVTFTDVDVTGGEWNRADVVYDSAQGAANPVVLPIGMLGGDDPQVYGGIIEAWGNTRRTVLSPDPDVPATLSSSWIEHMGPADQALETEVEQLIEDEGDQPPYAIVADASLDPIYLGNDQNAPRGIYHSPTIAIPTTGVPVHVSGGLFPLGLLKFQAFSSSENGFLFTVHLAPGKYKGVAARSMIS